MVMNLSNPFGAAIQRARKRLGLTRERLARDIGIEPAVIVRIEQGQYVPPRPVTLRLLKRLYSRADRDRITHAVRTQRAEFARRDIRPRRRPLRERGTRGDD